jgi:NADPH-dependent curcumin reductase CurA
MAVSAAMRSLMGDVAVPMPMYRVGQVLHGPAVGEVVSSGSSELVPGDWVRHGSGWREHAVVEVAQVRKIAPVRSAEQAVVQLGQGLTAYVGLRAAAPVREGDTVFVSGAAGAIGSIAGQIARLLGAGRVAGSAGSREKAAYLVEKLGFDAAFTHSDLEKLRKETPDVVFDTVGGELLGSAIEVVRPGGRVALCGALSHQLGGSPATVTVDLMGLIGKRISLRGFTASDHPELQADWLADSARWLAEGALVMPHREVAGLENAPGALLDLLAGRHLGTVVVSV